MAGLPYGVRGSPARPAFQQMLLACEAGAATKRAAPDIPTWTAVVISPGFHCCREIQLRGMSQDLSWGAAAQQYEAVLLAAKYQW